MFDIEISLLIKQKLEESRKKVRDNKMNQILQMLEE